MPKEIGPREKALREMREASFTENAKITAGIRRAAAEGKAVIEKTKKKPKKSRK